MTKTKIDLEGRDNASRAFKSASSQLADLRAEINRLRSTDVTVGDARKLNALTAEARGLERALGQVGKAGASSAGEMGSAFGQLQGVLSNLGLGNLGAVLGGAGVAAAGAAVGRLALSLGQAGEQALRSETYFRTFSGSASAAAANLTAVQTAVDGALSSQQAMQAATKLLSMGLATNSEELGQISRMAVLLGGDTRSASEAIEEFSLLLANQSILRLDTFGISGARVRTRIEELQAATTNLTREAAFMQAVFEIGGQKVAALEEAGVSAGRGMDRAAAAAADLKAELGKLVEKPYTVTVEWAADNLKALNAIISGQGMELKADAPASLLERMAGNAGPQADLRRAEEAYAAALADVEQAQARVAGWYARINPLARTNYEIKLREEEAALRSAQAQLDLARAVATNTAAVGISGDAERDYIREMEGTRTAVLETAAAVDELAAARLRDANVRTLLPQQGIGSEDWIGPAPYEANKAAAQAKIAAIELAQTQAQALSKANTTVAGDYSRKMSQAIDDLTPRVQDALQKGAQFSINLMDVRGGGGDPFAPGSNGPFENIYRLQAWLNDGSFGDLAAQLGIQSREAAQGIVAAFQSGNITPDVEAVIDVTALIDMIAVEQQAEAAYKAFAARIGKAAGADTSTAQAVVDAAFGRQATPPELAIKPVVDGGALDGLDLDRELTLTPRVDEAWLEALDLQGDLLLRAVVDGGALDGLDLDRELTLTPRVDEAWLEALDLQGDLLLRAVVDGGALDGLDLDRELTLTPRVDEAWLEALDLQGDLLLRAVVDGGALDGLDLDRDLLLRAVVDGGALDGLDLDRDLLLRAVVDGGALDGLDLDRDLLLRAVVDGGALDGLDLDRDLLLRAVVDGGALDGLDLDRDLLLRAVVDGGALDGLDLDRDLLLRAVVDGGALDGLDLDRDLLLRAVVDGGALDGLDLDRDLLLRAVVDGGALDGLDLDRDLLLRAVVDGGALDGLDLDRDLLLRAVVDGGALDGLDLDRDLLLRAVVDGGALDGLDLDRDLLLRAVVDGGALDGLDLDRDLLLRAVVDGGALDGLDLDRDLLLRAVVDGGALDGLDLDRDLLLRAVVDGGALDGLDLDRDLLLRAVVDGGALDGLDLDRDLLLRAVVDGGALDGLDLDRDLLLRAVVDGGALDGLDLDRDLLLRAVVDGGALDGLDLDRDLLLRAVVDGGALDGLDLDRDLLLRAVVDGGALDGLDLDRDLLLRAVVDGGALDGLDLDRDLLLRAVVDGGALEGLDLDRELTLTPRVDGTLVIAQADAVYAAFGQRMAELAQAGEAGGIFAPLLSGAGEGLAQAIQGMGIGQQVAGALLGTAQDDKGRSAIGTATERAMAMVASGLREQVDASEFRDSVTGYGAATWAYFQGGFVAAARQSVALQAAVQAMVYNAIAEEFA